MIGDWIAQKLQRPDNCSQPSCSSARATSWRTAISRWSFEHLRETTDCEAVDAEPVLKALANRGFAMGFGNAPVAIADEYKPKL